ncbi:MAG: hypothetical protein Q7Q73_02480 [Verrucomicrobiota bacterium JB024]|nr:hypothetical protein [Verrucomicrobiota bacterium JB024]
MATIPLIRRTFSAGEVSPDLHHRSDLEAYAQACKKLLNAPVNDRGLVERRYGTRLVAKLDKPGLRAIPFKFSVEETFQLVFVENAGAVELEVYTPDGTRVKTLSTVYTPAGVPRLQYLQQGDVIWLSDGESDIYRIERYRNSAGDIDWRVRQHPFSGGPYLDVNVAEHIQVYALPAIHTPNTWTGLTPAYNAMDIVYCATIGNEGDGAAAKLWSTAWPAQVQPWFARSHENIGRRQDKYTYYFKLRISCYGDPFEPGDVVRLFGTPDNAYDGTFVILEAGAGYFTLYANQSYVSDTVRAAEDWQEVTVPTVPAGTSGQARAFRVDVPHKFWRAKSATTTEPVAANAAYWDALDTYVGTVNLVSNHPVFEAGMVGAAFQIIRETEAPGDDFNVTGEASKPYPAHGEVKLQTEGGVWGGRLELQTSTNNGATWEVVASMVAEDGDYNGTTSADIEQPGSLVRVVMKEWKAPTGTAPAEGFQCKWKLEFSSVQYLHFVITGYVSETEVEAACVTPLTSVAGSYLWAEGAFCDKNGYPRAMAIFEERLIFGGTQERPSTVYASRTNNYEHFLEDKLETSAFSVPMATTSNDEIRWLLGVRHLLVGLDNSERVLYGRDEAEAFSAQNAQQRPQTYRGSAEVQVVTNDGLVYFVPVGQQRILTLMQGEVDVDSYRSSDITYLAPHLFSAGIRYMSLARHPHPRIYVTLADGSCCVYTDSELVKGWAALDYGGTVRNVFSNYSTAGDEVWLLIEREGVSFLEKEEDGLYLDCRHEVAVTGAVTDIPLPNAALDGLVVFCDGVELADDEYTLADGLLTVPGKADCTVTAGVRFTYDIQPTNPVEFGDSGKYKSASHVTLYLGPSGKPTVEINGHPAEVPEGPNLYNPALLEGIIPVNVTSGHTKELSVRITGNDHHPFKLRGLGIRALGGA